MGGVGSDSQAYAIVAGLGGLSEYEPEDYCFLTISNAISSYPGTQLSSAFFAFASATVLG